MKYFKVEFQQIQVVIKHIKIVICNAFINQTLLKTVPEQIVKGLILDEGVIHSKFKFCFCGKLSIKSAKKAKLLKRIFYEMLRIDKRILISNFRVVILDEISINACINGNNLFNRSQICPDVGCKPDFQVSAAVNHKP